MKRHNLVPDPRPLAERIRALMLEMLSVMSRLTPESSDEDFKRAQRRWSNFKRRAAVEAREPGEAYRVLDIARADPAFRVYDHVRLHRFHASDEYRTWRQGYDKDRYATRLKAARSTPEARERLRLARQRQRRKARLAGPDHLG